MVTASWSRLVGVRPPSISDRQGSILSFRSDNEERRTARERTRVMCEAVERRGQRVHLIQIAKRLAQRGQKTFRRRALSGGGRRGGLRLAHTNGFGGAPQRTVALGGGNRQKLLLEALEYTRLLFSRVLQGPADRSSAG